ncbi:MAG: pentapeptide repeat-containing protein [Chloroflexi bacterium]|nr:MAG: pentapeptide repeat-containing protein [Chloroflexota bacterium]
MRKIRPFFNKILSWITIGRVGIVLLIAALPGILISFGETGLSFGIENLLLYIYTEFAWEIASIAFTILIIDRIYQVQEVRLEKRQLIRQLRSSDFQLVREAADRLRARGWVSDSTLRNLNLTRAILRDVDWQTADLTNVTLEQADLRGIDLSQAQLTNASLEGADLSGARLEGTNLTEQQLRKADRLIHAIMPDGTKYDGRFHLTGDLREARTSGYNPDDPLAMARYYDV